MTVSWSLETLPDAIDSLAPSDLTDGVRPRRSPSVAQAQIRDHLLLAHERCAWPLVLSPLDAVLWESLTGETSIGELVDDIVASLRVPPLEQSAQVHRLLKELAAHGMLDHPLPIIKPRPRWLLPSADADQCIADRVLLGDADVMRASTVDASLRFATTDPEIARRIVANIGPGVELASDEATDVLPELTLRTSSGRRQRVQRLLDALGDVVWSGTSIDEAVEVTCSTVRGRLAATVGDGVWCRSTVLQAGPHVVHVHPGLTSVFARDLRRQLPDVGASLVASTMEPWPTVPEDRDREASRSLLLVPQMVRNPVHGALLAVHLAGRWDRSHLESVVSAAEADLVVGVPEGSGPDELLKTLEAIAAWSGSW